MALILHARTLNSVYTEILCALHPPQAPAMSVMQMVRGTLQALADAGPAWAMAIPPAPAPSAPMRSAHAVVLLDASGHCNLAATMTKASAALVGGGFCIVPRAVPWTLMALHCMHCAND